jgi:hypothetical protein
MMTPSDLSEFSRQYLQTWTEADPQLRHDQIKQVWAEDGRMSISSIAATIEGVDEIAEHIGRVHDDVVAGKGLRFDYHQVVESGDGLLLRSSVTAPDGSVVGRGADVIFRDADGKVTAAYMFMGVE